MDVPSLVYQVWTSFPSCHHSLRLFAQWTTKENLHFLHFFDSSGPRKKWLGMAPNGAGRFFFPANPNLANILGDTDFDCEIFFLGGGWGGTKFLAWAHPLGPSLGPPTWARLGPTHLGPAWAHPLGLGPGLGSPTWARLGPTHSSRKFRKLSAPRIPPGG